MVVEDQRPELVVAYRLAQRLEKVVPVDVARHVSHIERNFIVRAPAALLPGLPPRLSLQQRGHAVAEHPPDVGGRILRSLEGGDLALHPDQRLLSHLLCEVGVANQHATGLGPDEAVDGLQ